MNKNPLLVKSILIERIPFLREKTAKLYGRYLSNNRFYKSLSDHKLAETVSAYTLNSKYKLSDTQFGSGFDPKDLVFDSVEVSPSEFFSTDEWVALGMVLRAYKEIENLDLLHLYNCLYSAEGNKVTGFVITGRPYTLYTSTQLPIKIEVIDLVDSNIFTSGEIKFSSRNNPTVILPSLPGDNVEKVVKITLEFTGESYQPCTLVEGVYRGLSHRILNKGTSEILIPENLKIGEYSDKLIEFLAGTLVTPLSDYRLLNSLGGKLACSISELRGKVIENTKGFYNQDGYLDRRSKI